MEKIANAKILKKAVVVHSGGMDSSICLALAVEQFGAENVLSLSFTYGQRHLKVVISVQDTTETKLLCLLLVS